MSEDIESSIIIEQDMILECLVRGIEAMYIASLNKLSQENSYREILCGYDGLAKTIKHTSY